MQHAVLAGLGDVIVYTRRHGNPDSEESRILHVKQHNPALHPSATRRPLRTQADDKHYAFLKTAEDGSQRVLAVYNFQSTSQRIMVDLTVLSTSGLIDLLSGEKIPYENPFKFLEIELPAFGYGFYEVLPPAKTD